jgi:Fimbrial assembly protein (PilN)
MINLIPPHGHTALTHEYILRVASVYGFLLTAVFVASAILLIPVYVLTSAQMTGVRDESARVLETQSAFDAAFQEIKVANTIMARLHEDTDDVPLSGIIEEIVDAASPGVTFTTFQAVREGVMIKQVLVQGTAADRNALASFKNALESSPRFAEAAVPISDLARDKNLSFAITVTLSEEVNE